MPKNHKRPPPPVVTRKTVYWTIAVIFVCYMLHISSEVRTLSNFVETDPNDVYHLLKDPVNLLVLHPKAVEIQILDKRSQMTLEFAEFYMTEQLSFGNSTTLINLIANPVERKVTLQVNAFLNLLKISVEWNIYGINKGSNTYTQIMETIDVRCPLLFKYYISETLYHTHLVMLNRINDQYSKEPQIHLV